MEQNKKQKTRFLKHALKHTFKTSRTGAKRPFVAFFFIYSTACLRLIGLAASGSKRDLYDPLAKAIALCKQVREMYFNIKRGPGDEAPPAG